jgi:hypothetical protein
VEIHAAEPVKPLEHATFFASCTIVIKSTSNSTPCFACSTIAASHINDTSPQGILKLGIKIDMVPQGTFYVWADLSGLPHPLNDGITFFEECIKEKLICVPGIFFDINPVCGEWTAHT